jgi:hypothetical protein
MLTAKTVKSFGNLQDLPPAAPAPFGREFPEFAR